MPQEQISNTLNNNSMKHPSGKKRYMRPEVVVEMDMLQEVILLQSSSENGVGGGSLPSYMDAEDFIDN